MTQPTHSGEPEASSPSAPQVPQTTPAPSQDPAARPPTRRSLRGTEWEKIAAVTAAAAAALGLVFTAWTAYIAQEVARDQLSQSQQQDAESERSQAASTNAWVEQNVEDGVQTLVVANRFPDPIKDVVVGLIVDGLVDEFRNGKTQSGEGIVIIAAADSIPPCAKVEMELEEVYITKNNKSVPLMAPKVQDYFLAFKDANAKEWERDKYGSLTRKSQNSKDSTRNKYISLLDTPKYDGPHQPNVDRGINAYKPIDCGNRS
ncbi:hypothetical protein [Streptomyces tauricus]|uniref:hypothetical protein n=1 Tax=Streptomyces tauricus TaxID=68274 RepID=UPI00380C9652